jgi:hypothetical protein
MGTGHRQGMNDTSRMYAAVSGNTLGLTRSTSIRRAATNGTMRNGGHGNRVVRPVPRIEVSLSPPLCVAKVLGSHRPMSECVHARGSWVATADSFANAAAEVVIRWAAT